MGQGDDTKIYSKSETLTDLQTHQIELEMHDRALTDMQQQLEEVTLRYTDLYDNTPIGFITLNQAGNILAINRTGTKMLGMSYPSIVNKPFANYIHQDDRHVFFYHLQQTFNSLRSNVAELRITDPLANTKSRHTRLESSVMKSAGTCCTIMTDIDKLKEASSSKHELLHENRQLMQSLFKAQEKERFLLAHELHDELGQWLTAISLESETILNHTHKESTIGISALAIVKCVKKMHTVIRDMLHQVRPALLDTLGLVDALLELKKHWHAHHPNITLEFKFEGELKTLGEHINITVFRIIQEALNNSCGHAQATWAGISLNHLVGTTSEDDVITLCMEDNGKGYDLDQKSKGLGLLGMRERTIAAGGKFSIVGAPNHGTQIKVKLPLGSLNKRRRTDEL